jgi:hypothetical protein
MFHSEQNEQSIGRVEHHFLAYFVFATVGSLVSSAYPAGTNDEVKTGAKRPLLALSENGWDGRW